jgi:hypothetical protein
MGSLSAELIIDTICGNGDNGFNGDFRNSKDTSIHKPTSICKDDLGNIYIADTWNNRIRKIDTEGKVHTVAGTGEFGENTGRKAKFYAVAARLSYPMGIAVETVDKNSKKVRLYIADTMNNKIKMVNEFGIIRTIAGSGKPAKYPVNGVPHTADLSHPRGVIFYKGNVYFADTDNNAVRVIYNPNQMKNPSPIVSAPQIIEPQNGYLYNIAGTGKKGFGGNNIPATLANCNKPWDVSIMNDELYFTDKNNHVIRKVNKDGVISIVAGLPMEDGFYGDVLKATKEPLNAPHGIWNDGTYIYFTDSHNSRIRKLDVSTDTISTISGLGRFGFSGDTASALDCTYSKPLDIIGDDSGNLLVVDCENSRIRILKTKEGSQEPTTIGKAN